MSLLFMSLLEGEAEVRILDQSPNSPNSGRRGLFSPGSHSTPHAGPYGALPPD